MDLFCLWRRLLSTEKENAFGQCVYHGQSALRSLKRDRRIAVFSLLSKPPTSFVMPRGSLDWNIMGSGKEMKPISHINTCYLHIHDHNISLQIVVKYLTTPLEICLSNTCNVASINCLCSGLFIYSASHIWQQDLHWSLSPRTLMLMVRRQENCPRNRLGLTRHIHGTAIDLPRPFLACT